MAGAGARAACYAELRMDSGPTLFGVGIHENIVTASFLAVLCTVNRRKVLQSEINADVAQAE